MVVLVAAVCCVVLCNVVVVVGVEGEVMLVGEEWRRRVWWWDTNCLLGVSSSFGEEKMLRYQFVCVTVVVCDDVNFFAASALLQQFGSASPCHRLFFSA